MGNKGSYGNKQGELWQTGTENTENNFTKTLNPLQIIDFIC